MNGYASRKYHIAILSIGVTVGLASFGLMTATVATVLVAVNTAYHASNAYCKGKE